MTEFDVHKLQTKSIKITVKWSTIIICLTFIANTVFWSFKFGSYFNEQKAYVKETRQMVEENKKAVMSNSIDINALKISESRQDADISNLKLKIK